MGRGGGGVKAASGSSIEITFMYRGVRCRERIQLQPTATNLKRVALHRAAILHAIDNGTFDYAVTFPSSPRATLFAPEVRQDTVAAFLDWWLERKQKHLKASTYTGYTKIINAHLRPLFGTKLVAELTRREIRTALDGLAASNKTLSNIQSCLRSALSDAVEEEIIEVNPLGGWTYRRQEAPATVDDVDPFDTDEQAAILSALAGQARNLIQFAFWTGLRTSELAALNWSDVDWLRKEVRVSRALTQAADEPETTKTTAGERTIKLLAPALEALAAQKAHTLLAGEEIFQNPRTNARWTGDQPIRRTLWVHALKRAGVRYRRPYQTRHTYASMMLSAGEHPMWVAQQMGHANWLMIARVYGRWMPTADPDAGSRAESKFGNNDSKMTTLSVETP